MMNDRAENKKTEPAAWLRDAFMLNQQVANEQANVRSFRQQHWAQFSQRGLPTRREEAWKYTDVSFLGENSFHCPEMFAEIQSLNDDTKALLLSRAENNTLLVFINGYFMPLLSSTDHLPAGILLGSVQQFWRTHTSLLQPYLLREVNAMRYPFVCLNAAFSSDGLFLYAPRHVVMEKPVHVVWLANQPACFMTHPRHVVILEEGSQVTLTEEYLACGATEHYWTNVSADFFIGEKAHLNYYKIQNEAKNAQHIAHLFFHQQQQSQVNAFSFALGGQFARNDMTVALQGAHAVCRLNGFYGPRENGQLSDHHLFVEHAAPYTRSQMHFRGVLSGQSRAVFNGKVIVRPEAKKTQASQFNHNILLSPLAEVNTKPELEIYADDVQCRHGATVGQLDEEALFYLCARGIDPQAAIAMLLQAFIESVWDEVTLPWLRHYMKVSYEKMQA